MFHDDDGVPHIPQSMEVFEESEVIPLVKSDARLVENVHDTHKTRADLGGQTDPLSFTG